jgi:tetratricopeptide (TPR) repeat protein
MTETPEDKEIEDLVARAMELVEGMQPGELEKLLADHPEHAARIRERLSALERLGLLHPASTERAPERLGRYRIVSKLGEGGMSVVYLARDDVLDRPVALKVARAPLAGGERARERFRREIRAASTVRHPCLVPIHDAGEEDGRPWLAMEHIEGATLADIVERLRALGRPPSALESADFARAVLGNGEPERGTSWGRTYVESVCRIVADVADALQALHDAGILHRDVKPANVLVRPDGRALLFDLGLAHLDELPALTRTGEFAGTPSYVAPEQVVHGASKAEAASDVYSLGVTLYELLTLRRPFEAASAVELWRAITRDEPPLPRRFHASLARDLETICLTTLEKDPRRRYASASAFGADLRRFLEYRRIEARPVGALRRGLRILRRDPSLAAAVALALAIFLALPIGLLWANSAIRVERDTAQHEREVGKEVLDFFIDLGREVGEDRTGGEGAALARGYLDRGVERLTVEFGDRPFVRAGLMEALGRMYASLGEWERALPLLDRALAVELRARGEAIDETANLMGELARVHLESGDAASAFAIGERALSAFAASGRRDSSDATDCRTIVGRAALGLGDLDRAETCLREALQDVRAIGEGGGDAEAGVLEGLAGVARARGEDELAREHLERAVELRRAQWAPRPEALALALDDLAHAERARGGIERATTLESEAERLRSAGPGAAPGALPDVFQLFDFEPAWGQEYRASFQQGITALQTGDAERAFEAFQRCLEWNPRASVCAYNSACARAIAGRKDEALSWLTRAIDMGFAHGPSRIEAVRLDPDLAVLRGSAAFESAVERLGLERSSALRYATTPSTYVPDAITSRTAWPLLVVLHADGSTREEVLRGAWHGVADAMDCALLAPSARRPTAGAPEHGMAWFEEPVDLARERWEYEPAVLDGVRAFAREHALEPASVWIAGEGMGGVVALDLALRAPGLFRGVILCDAPLLPQVDLARARTAAALGMRVAYLARPDGGFPTLHAGTRAGGLASLVRSWLGALGLGPGAWLSVEDGRWPSEEKRAEALEAALRGITAGH